MCNTGFILIDEGKAVASAPRHHLRLSIGKTKPKDLATERKIGQTIGLKKLNEVQSKTREQLTSAIAKYQSGKLTGLQLREQAVGAMRKAWNGSFAAGVRASGAPGVLGTQLKEADRNWLRGAQAHEMRYLNKFIRDVEEDRLKMPADVRANLYVEALRSFYESARIIGLPSNVVIHWVSNGDHSVCLGCQYLAENSPYSKYNIPTVPSAGSCQCLSRCRCRCYVRHVTVEEAQRVRRQSKFTREQHLRNLQNLKRRKRRVII